MMGIEIHGTPVTADNLETLLRLCAEHLGGDYKPESESWGDGAAGRFMREAAGTSLYDEAVRVLCGFLTDGNPDQVKMAAGLIGQADLAISNHRCDATPRPRCLDESPVAGRIGPDPVARCPRLRASF